MSRGRNPGIRVPAPGEVHPSVIAAIQQIIGKFGWQATPTFAGIGISGFSTAGFVKNTAAGVFTGGNALTVSDIPTHDLISKHSASGLTAGYVVRASGATTFAWAQLPHSDLSNLAYASAGHTGFEPTVTKGDLTAGSNKITIGGTGTGAVIGAGASVDVAEVNLTHNNLGGLQGGTAGEYNHLTNAQVAALHAAVTVAAAPLTLAGQAITFNYDAVDFQLDGNNLQVKDGGIAHDSTSGVHQNVNTGASPTFAGLTLTGNVTVPSSFTMSLTGGSKVRWWDGTPDAVVITHTDADTPGVLRICPNGSPATWMSALQFFGTDYVADQVNYSNLNIFAWSDSFRIYTANSGSGTLYPLRLGGNGAATTLYLHTDGNVGINASTPDAKLEVQTSATFGGQAVTIDQDDADQAFIDFQGTSAADVSKNITTDIDQWTFGGLTRHEVNGETVWIPYYTSGGTGNLTPNGAVTSITLREGAGYDYSLANFTRNGNYIDLNLSSILPAGTTKFWCRIAIAADAAGKIFFLRKNGNTGTSDMHGGCTQVGGVTYYADLGPIGVDGSRVCEYMATNESGFTWNAISLVITAYQ